MGIDEARGSGAGMGSGTGTGSGVDRGGSAAATVVEAERGPAVVIVHHADGSAEVNGLPVPLAPGEDVREAAYLTAVALVSGSGSSPVPAVRIEPDGTQYPLMLYPGRTVMAADPAATPRRALASFLLNRMVVGACGCVFLTALLTTLLVAHDGGGDQAKPGSPAAAAPVTFAGDTAEAVRDEAARGIRSALTATVNPAVRTGAVAGANSTKPDSHAGAAARRRGPWLPGNGGPGRRFSGGWPGGGLRKRYTAPSPAVGDLTLTVVGGQPFDAEVAYVITVSTSSTDPFTLTYSYSGSRSSLRATHRVVLSGQTEYMLSDTFPGEPFCGGTVTMQASTQPPAATGPVTAATTPGC